MLKNKADRKTLLFMLISTGLLIAQWNIGTVQPILVFAAVMMAIPVAVMAHNHNHLPMWKSDVLNKLTDYWITMFYGFPTCAWIPTHNMNHHVYNNRVPDDTITYRYSEKNNLVTLLTYPSISGYFQQNAIKNFFKTLYKKDRKKFLFYASQYALIVLYVGGALLLDWKKALLFIVLPQQVSLFSVLIFNYIQHVHADEESKWNHSRNFVGWGMNAFLFNNGYHTVHHMQPRLHWSETPKVHNDVAHNIDPALLENSFWGYIGRNYILGAFIPKFRTVSMRQARMQRPVAPSGSASTKSARPSHSEAVSATELQMAP